MSYIIYLANELSSIKKHKSIIYKDLQHFFAKNTFDAGIIFDVSDYNQNS